MRTFKLIIVAYCILSIISAITGISSCEATNGETEVAYFEGWEKSLPVLLSLCFGALLFGIHHKVYISYYLGWIALVFSYSYFVISGSLNLLHKDGMLGQVIALAIICFATILFWRWAQWWKKQKSYFIQPQEQ